MSSLLLATPTSSQLFRSATLPSPSSPSPSPKSDDIVMEFPSSPPFLSHDIPSTPTTPGPGSSFGHRSAYRPPNSAKRTRRIPHVNTDPYPTTTMHQSSRRLSAIPTDNDVENAYRNMSDYEGSGNMSPVTRRRLPTLPARSVFHDSTIQSLSQGGQLLSPLPIRGGPPIIQAPVPRSSNSAADDLNETLAQAIKLLSLEKKPESYSSTSVSSQSSPHATSSTTSYADDQFQFASSSANSQSSLPDPEELLKEIVRNSLQSLHALRLAKAMERDMRGSRRGSTEDGMEVESNSALNQEIGGTAGQVVAYLEQSVSTINSARQYIEFAEETLCDTRDRVRDALMKG